MMLSSSVPSSKSGRYALVLAGGKGDRLKSKTAKVLHPLCGKPLIQHVLDTLTELELDRILVVIGHEADAIRAALANYPVEFVEQTKQLGTGHAVQCAASQLRQLQGYLLVLYGDTPLISATTLGNLLETAQREKADQVLVTVHHENPAGLGRILRDENGKISDIVEEKDASPEQRAIHEINPGFNCFKIDSLVEGLTRLSSDNRAGEYYLTDLVRILSEGGGRVLTVPPEDPEETYGINDRRELAEMSRKMRRRIAERWMAFGVTLIDPENVYIDATVELSPDSTLYPGVVLEGRTRVGTGCVIYGYSHLSDAVIEEDCTIDHCSVIRSSRIGAGSRVGPFAHIREHSEVGAETRIGNFVEVKKSSLGDGTKAAHLTYLGDAKIGKKVNIGAGTITCNYDGVRKHTTVIEDDVFIGSNSQLIAPVTIRRGAYVAAGSTITDEVPPDSLAIARSRQTNKPGWSGRKRKPSP